MNLREHKTLLIGACLLLLTGVQLGALGAHALDDILTPAKQNSWELAVQYQLIHALGIVLIVFLRDALNNARLLVIASWLMLAGIFLFSGSIYVSALNVAPVAAQVAPFGGSAFMLAWLLVAVAVFRS